MRIVTDGNCDAGRERKLNRARCPIERWRTIEGVDNISHTWTSTPSSCDRDLIAYVDATIHFSGRDKTSLQRTDNKISKLAAEREGIRCGARHNYKPDQKQQNCRLIERGPMRLVTHQYKHGAPVPFRCYAVVLRYSFAIVMPMRGRCTLPKAVAKDGECVKDDVAEAGRLF